MLFKYLEILKQSEDNDLKELLEQSFQYFSSNRSNKISDKITNSKSLSAGFSSLVRFYRSLNANKKIDDDQINQLVKELFKGKTSDLNSILINQINNIISVQNKRINFTEIKLGLSKNRQISDDNSNENLAKREFLINNILEFKSFSWKIKIAISNNISNRVLLPEIIFMFTLIDEKSHTFIIDIKVFQELRRLLTIHIKRMLENEQNALLK